MELFEYDFPVEHRPNTELRRTDALSRCIHLVTDGGALTREVIREAHNRGPTCEMYKTRRDFWLDGEQLLYYGEQAGSSFVVIEGN
jgi:hypothetical protein